MPVVSLMAYYLVSLGVLGAAVAKPLIFHYLS